MALHGACSGPIPGQGKVKIYVGGLK